MMKKRFEQTISKALDNYWSCDWMIASPGVVSYGFPDLLATSGLPSTNTIELLEYRSNNSIEIDFDRIKDPEIIENELEENWIFELSADTRLEITFHKAA